jgi:hypothetical protein
LLQNEAIKNSATSRVFILIAPFVGGSFHRGEIGVNGFARQPRSMYERIAVNEICYPSSFTCDEEPGFLRAQNVRSKLT